MAFIDKIYGNISGLSSGQLKNISRLYRRKVPQSDIITTELARTLADISCSADRNISVLLNRKGKVKFVHVGDPSQIEFSKLIGRIREARYRLRGYRLIHSNLKNSGFTDNNLATLVNERLDLICALDVSEDGKAAGIQIAHMLPAYKNGSKKWQIYSFRDSGRIDIQFDQIVEQIENDLERAFYSRGGDRKKEGVFLVGFDNRFRTDAENSLDELKSLALSSGKTVLDSTIQIRKHADPRYLIGKGKLKDAILRAEQLGAETLIFDVELTPTQVNSISDQTKLNITDRTQLILQIFAKHASSSEGKLQVKLAELRYNLPRLRGRGIELSQLGGGIGTRGPGEKKLETQKRRIRKQIDDLEQKIEKISRRRAHTRKKRFESGIHTVSFIGYTNVGKSTLFNALTSDNVVVRNKLFSTLNPTTRKYNLPGGKNVLLTDTVGFISKLPEELVNAFRATLEELGESSLLVHVADASDPLIDERIESVENVLSSMQFDHIPRIMVLNKRDKTTDDVCSKLSSIYNTPVISAYDKSDIARIAEYIDMNLAQVGINDSDITYRSTG